MGKEFKANHKRLVPQPPSKTGSMRMFDLDNPDIDLFNMVDDELIRMSGSELYIYKYEVDENFDDLYGENRTKALNPEGILVEGHYDPRAFEENLTEFGIEMTNDQIFTFNKSYIEAKLGRPLIAGDVIQPRFQNVFFDVYEVQQDSFEVYGVYHLLASARVLREKPEIIPLGAGQSQADIYEPTDFGDGPGAPQGQEKTFTLYQGLGTRIDELDEEDPDYKPYTDAQQLYVRENVPKVLFMQEVPKIKRDRWITQNPKYSNGIRVNFTTVSKDTVDENGWGQYVQLDADDNKIVILKTNYLMKFGDPAWINARLASIPNYENDPTLVNSNLTYLYTPKCEMYPTPRLGGNEYLENQPEHSPATWRQEMINGIEYLRATIDRSVDLIVHCVRNGSEYNDPPYKNDPSLYFEYDGSAGYGPDRGQAGVIEPTLISADYELPDPIFTWSHNIWKYTLRVIIRMVEEGHPVVSKWRTNRKKEFLLPVRLEERISNWASYALVHQQGKTNFNNLIAGGPKFVENYPGAIFPEDGVELGHGVNGVYGEIPAVLRNANAQGQIARPDTILSREFDSGYVAIYNATPDDDLRIPDRYLQGDYWLVTMNNGPEDLRLQTNGIYTGEIEFEEILNSKVPVGEGRMLKRKTAG